MFLEQLYHIRVDYVKPFNTIIAEISHLTQDLQREAREVGGRSHGIRHEGCGGHLVVLLPVPEEPHQVNQGERGQGQGQQSLADAQQSPWDLSTPGGGEAAKLKRKVKLSLFMLM